MIMIKMIQPHADTPLPTRSEINVPVDDTAARGTDEALLHAVRAFNAARWACCAA